MGLASFAVETAQERLSDWKPLVLLVDDSAAQRQLLAIYLRRFGCDLIEAASGEEGLAICQTHKIDVVISDLMMPGMSGIDFCRHFRTLPRASYGYFILLTSNSERASVALGLEAGADDFVTKPVSAEELRSRLRPALRILTMQSELMVKNRQIAAALGEQKRLFGIIERDLIEARKLQLTLMPETYRDFGQAGVSMLIRPSGHVGGDLIGCLRLDAERIAAYSIDVSGHGVASAMMTARLAGYFSGSLEERLISWRRGGDGILYPRRPAEVAAAFNALMLNDIRAEQYFTMVYAEMRLTTGEVSFVQAGHPHPLLLRKSGEIETLGSGGLPIGLIENARYEDQFIRLGRGDRIILTSDGMTECPSADGEELGEKGLEHLVSRFSSLAGPAFFDALLEGLARHAGGASFPDDVSGLMLDYRG